MAWCFDRAVAVFGLAVEADLTEATQGAKNEAQAKAKHTRALARWLAEPGTTPKGLYRDPASRFARK